MIPSMGGHPLSLETLTRYWFGECSGELERSIDEHVLACDLCAGRLQEIVTLGDGVRRLARTCGGGAVVTAAFVSRLKSQGVRVREYSMQPGGSVFCTIAPEDDLAVSYLSAPLADVERLDLVLNDPGKPTPQRLTDIPFNAAAGSIVFAPNVAWLRTLQTVTQQVQLVSVEGSGERVIAQFTFNHSPHRP